jgi:hypothetical protein
VLSFEATVHSIKERRCRRSLENFGEIITRLGGMADWFATTLDCGDTGFLPDGILYELPLPSQTGTCRTAGIDLNKPRTQAALSAALALVPAPGAFTVAEHAAPCPPDHRHDGYTSGSPPKTCASSAASSPRMGRKSKTWTAVDRRYHDLRVRMQDLFRDLGITVVAPHRHFCRSERCKLLSACVTYFPGIA